jgi:hypothetical protein
VQAFSNDSIELPQLPHSQRMPMTAADSSIQRTTYGFRKRLKPTFAALGDISNVISFPSSSTRGFCVTTVVLEREVFEKGRVCVCGALEVDGIGRDTVV